jgi:diaminopimelate epimerase
MLAMGNAVEKPLRRWWLIHLGVFHTLCKEDDKSEGQPVPFTDEKTGIVPRGRPFVKMHGLRNDFIILDARRQLYRPSAEEISRICDRREGIGGDELLIIESPRPESVASDACAFVRIFNPDGREVEACGNASRCLGWLFMQKSGRQEALFDTIGGQLRCREMGEKQMAVEMGRLRTDWQDIPLASEMNTLHLGIGAGPLQDPVGMNIGNIAPIPVLLQRSLIHSDSARFSRTIIHYAL